MDILLAIIIAAILVYAIGYRLGTRRGRLESRLEEFRRGFRAGYDQSLKDLENPIRKNPPDSYDPTLPDHGNGHGFVP